MTDGTAGFAETVNTAARQGRLVVQPRMGFSSPRAMRTGLLATKRADATTVGTLTLDSYTRVGDLASVERALAAGLGLNGYPIVNYGPEVTRWLLAGVRDHTFPVQVRHGSAVPLDIFRALARNGIDATEGGPVSYCLPYGRTPLADSIRNWSACCELFATLADTGLRPHLETFGGCMMGQLCPPSHLIAISVLEALFFREHGITSVSLSYAQQTSPEQDRESVAALRRLCAELLGDIDWHVVIYAYMGLFPRTPGGARRLLAQAAALAAATGAERLIVKTTAEARRIPTVEENVAALETAATIAADTPRQPADHGDSETYTEARAIIDAVRDLAPRMADALLRAFKRGVLDIPYCLHPDNRGQTSSFIDDAGRLRWADTGALPLPASAATGPARTVGSTEFLSALSYMQWKFDTEPLDPEPPGREHAVTNPGNRE
ncbi:methylaspartate mutase [Streptomyces sp. DSM 44915]|uniref:Methylaspartate mutase n=1 Tax=Streptomyces chisholmiae TaxID=3075540 RepID=A0ABU2JW87_9ACTN|nr:methylaspartate mutase [Streptomyces sp. DSM 44915]MDT0269266.1 methylaspartate mutase [Streptomyces sp. DSM 44915]